MKITDGVYLVGSGGEGVCMTNNYDSHVYLVEGSEGHIMIDAGVGLEVHRIIENIEKDGIDPESVKYLFITHVHSDHAGGSAELKEKFGLKVYVPSGDAEIIRTADYERLGLVIAKADNIYPEDYMFPPCEPDVELDGGETFIIGDLNIQVIHTPGHSHNSMCYLIDVKGKRCLFSGDAVLHNGKLLILNFEGCTMEGYRNSMPKLANLDIDALMPGHGLFVLNDAQEHVNMAIEALKHLAPPPAMW